MVGKDPLTNDDALRWRCFDATYAARLLTDGYGFPEHEAAIEFLGEIDGVEVEWTLGALLSKLLSGGAMAPLPQPTATATGGGTRRPGTARRSKGRRAVILRPQGSRRAAAGRRRRSWSSSWLYAPLASQRWRCAADQKPTAEATQGVTTASDDGQGLGVNASAGASLQCC